MHRASASALCALVLAAVVGCGAGQTSAHRPHPTGHDEVVLRIVAAGGLTTLEGYFSRTPDLVVTGDGTGYAPAEDSTMRGIVVSVVRFRVPERTVQELLQRADHDHLLATPPDYAGAEDVMDAPTTAVVLATDTGRWTHSAYALGIPGTETPARDRLADFVAAAHDGLGPVGGTPYQPVALRVLARIVPDAATMDLDGTVRPWPARVDVHLADVGDCAVIDAPAALRTLTHSDARYYTQAGHSYAVAAAVPLPGDDCGADEAS